jgi:predicted naringenin-chalcone synthase
VKVPAVPRSLPAPAPHATSGAASKAATEAAAWPACILGAGSAYPAASHQYSQEQLVEAYITQKQLVGGERAWALEQFRDAGVQTRGLSMELDKLYSRRSDAGDPGGVDLIVGVQQALEEMLVAAATQALREWGGDPRQVTHLIFGTSSRGCYAPSPEVMVRERLQLSVTVQRVSMDHLGCVTGNRALATACELACAAPSHRVLLLYGEVGSLRSYVVPAVPTHHDTQGAALWSDGVAAMVVGARPRTGERPSFEVHASSSHVSDRWRDHGAQLHRCVAADVGAFVDGLLHSAGVSRGACTMLCHPSSAQVLSTVADTLGLRPEQTELARTTLAQHGNTLGAANLQMLYALQQSTHAPSLGWAVSVAYDAGQGLDGVLLRRVGAAGVAPTTAAPAAMAHAGPPCILSMGSAWPPEHFQYSQEDILSALLAQTQLAPEDRAFAQSVYRGTQVERRGLALPLDELYTSPTSMQASEALRDRVVAVLAEVLLAAAETALAEWGEDRACITHLVLGSLSFDHVRCDLVARLGLSSSVKRVYVDHMGCLAGFRCVGVASQIAAANPTHRVLTMYGDSSVLLGTHLPPKPNKLDLMSVSLFADGAAAAVVGCAPAGGERAVYEVHGVRSRLIPDSREDMYMLVMEDAVTLNVVSPRVPIFIGKGVVSFVQELMDETGLTMDECALLCHPGGKTILETVENKLHLSREQTNSSWSVLRAHGNMSGCTNLMVADHYRHSEQRHQYRWGVCVSFGPGLGMEGLLLRLVDDADDDAA